MSPESTSGKYRSALAKKGQAGPGPTHLDQKGSKENPYPKLPGLDPPALGHNRKRCGGLGKLAISLLKIHRPRTGKEALGSGAVTKVRGSPDP